MSKKNEVAETKNNMPAMASMYQEDAGAGYEEADKDSFAIPFIAILQALSPQVDESDGAYIEGAKQGMFLNTVTSEVFETLNIIPVHYNRTFTEWGLREEGGGFKGEHPPEEGIDLQATATRDEKSRDVLPNGNQIVDSRNHYVLIETSNGWQPVMVSFTSTQVKKSRKWMTSMNQIKVDDGTGRMFNPPMFANLYHMSTVKEKNDSGSWFNFKLERVGFVDDEAAYQLAKEFREQVKSGEAKAAHDSSNTESSDSSDAVRNAPDDDVPDM